MSGTTTINNSAGDTSIARPGGTTETSGVVTPGTGPLTDHLRVFANYENWAASDPLPNEFPNNSGIQSYADNNTVEEETGSPLIGDKSGDYTASRTEYHNGPVPSIRSDDFYLSLWVELDDLSDFRIWASTLGANVETGFELRYNGPNDRIRFLLGTGSGRNFFEADSFGGLSTGTTYFVEAWYTTGNDTAHLRVNDGVEETVSTSFSESAEDLHIGARPGGDLPHEGRLDHFAFEVAPPGDLEWPSESTWLYNNGDGRSFGAIKGYQP